MRVKLLRCSAEWVKIGGHPCWRVEKALIDEGIDYEIVAGSSLPWRRDRRTELIEKTGANLFPAIEFEDGSIYREQSSAMVDTIRAGRLFDRAGAPTAPAASST